MSSQITLTQSPKTHPLAHTYTTHTYASVSSCDQLIVDTTHARGGTLDLRMTDVPDLVRVDVLAPIGNSDHSSLSAVI